MNEQEFEELWQRAEGAEHGRQLAKEYPLWRQAQRRTLGVTFMLAAMVAVAVPLFTPRHATKDFENVYCNRAGTADAQWAGLASTLLIESYTL